MEDTIFFGPPRRGGGNGSDSRETSGGSGSQPNSRNGGGRGPLININGGGCLPIIIILIIGAVIWLKYHPLASIEKIETTEYGPKIISDFQQTGKLQFYKEEVQEMGIYKRYIAKVNTSDLEILYYGTMQFGTDLSHISSRNIEIDSANGTLTFHAPKCRLLYDDFINEELSKQHYDNSWMNFSQSEANECKQNAKNKMLEKHLEQGIRMAETLGEDYLSTMIRKMGYKGKIIVKFDQ